MIKRAVRKRIDKFEREGNYDASYTAGCHEDRGPYTQLPVTIAERAGVGSARAPTLLILLAEHLGL